MYPIRKTLTVKERSVSFVSRKSAAMKPTAGANMLEARGDINVNALIKPRRPNFFPSGKF